MQLQPQACGFLSWHLVMAITKLSGPSELWPTLIKKIPPLPTRTGFLTALILMQDSVIFACARTRPPTPASMPSNPRLRCSEPGAHFSILPWWIVNEIGLPSLLFFRLLIHLLPPERPCEIVHETYSDLIPLPPLVVVHFSFLLQHAVLHFHQR